MKYTENQARRKAQQIFTRFGQLIHDACRDTGVSESFLAGFTGVEAGVDRNGNINPEATRFEPGVYQDLISLRDNGYCFVGGKKRTNYSGVSRSQIRDASDAAIRALATSYSFTQIMGWHTVNNLKCTIADLRDPGKHFYYTIRLLKLVGGVYMSRQDLPSVLKIWNTGSASGKTYSPDYVENALLVKKYYEEILEENPNAFKGSAIEPGGNPAVNTSNLGQTRESVKNSAENPLDPNSADAQSPTQLQTSVDNSGKTEVQATQSVARTFLPESFQAYIPQIDTAKRYFKTISGLTGLSAAGAFFGGLPQWIVIALLVLLIVATIGVIAIFVRYYDRIFAYVTAMNTLRATDGVHNPELSSGKPKS